jgi:hypothetical protein
MHRPPRRRRAWRKPLHQSLLFKENIMLNRAFVSALALALAVPAFAAEAPATAEKPKCECCAKMEGDAKDCCCCDKKKAADGTQGEHKDHAAH